MISQTSIPYPVPRLAWIPDKMGIKPDLIITAGDFMRLWSISDTEGISIVSLFCNDQQDVYPCPVTSVAWNPVDLSSIISTSHDGMCSIWNINTGYAIAQVASQESPCLDVAFDPYGESFITVGSSGALKHYTLSSPHHFNVLYSSPTNSPLLHVAWNQANPCMVAVSHADECRVSIVDIRMPNKPVVELQGHRNSINSIQWCPDSPTQLITAGGDNKILLWDITDPLTLHPNDSAALMELPAEASMVSWNRFSPGYVSLSCGKEVRIYHI